MTPVPVRHLESREFARVGLHVAACEPSGGGWGGGADSQLRAPSVPSWGRSLPGLLRAEDLQSEDPKIAVVACVPLPQLGLGPQWPFVSEGCQPLWGARTGAGRDQAACRFPFPQASPVGPEPHPWVGCLASSWGSGPRGSAGRGAPLPAPPSAPTDPQAHPSCTLAPSAPSPRSP